jgi:outer membrane immunogenic protein
MLGSIGMLGLMTQANAQDFETPTLRGSSPYIPAPPKFTRWEGFYVGGHGAYGSSGMNFGGSTGDLVGFILRQTAVESEHGVSKWPLLGKTTTSAGGLGAFAGYNTQWDNAIVGIDVTYTHMRVNGAASGGIARQVVTSSDFNNLLDITGTSSLTIKDYFTLRGRLGASFGRFLPYATFGAAVGIADYSRSVAVDWQGIYVGDDDPPLPGWSIFETNSSNKKNMVIYGYAAGLGLDVALGDRAFLRGEWEWVQFVTPGDVDAYISTIRAGVGLRF